MSPIAQIRRNLPFLETPNGRKSLTLLAHTSSTSAETKYFSQFSKYLYSRQLSYCNLFSNTKITIHASNNLNY